METFDSIPTLFNSNQSDSYTNNFNSSTSGYLGSQATSATLPVTLASPGANETLQSVTLQPLTNTNAGCFSPTWLHSESLDALINATIAETFGQSPHHLLPNSANFNSNDSLSLWNNNVIAPPSTPSTSIQFPADTINPCQNNQPIDVDSCSSITFDGSPEYRCPVCDHEPYRNRQSFVIHLRNHSSNPRPYTCPNCTASFKQVSHWKSHLKTHVAAKSFICPICSLSFKLKHHLMRHVQSCHQIEPPRQQFPCIMCEKNFYDENALEKHKNVAHEEFQCRTCNKILYGTKQLVAHENEHQRLTNLTCSVCKMICTNSYRLKRHMLKHSNTRPFICHECGCEFKTKTHLKQHSNVHTAGDGTKLQCPLCDKEFKWDLSLKRHLAVHGSSAAASCTGKADVRPYKCPKCNRGFDRKDVLKQHYQTHEDRKNQCEHCGIKFLRSKDLEDHKTQHINGAKPFVCECGNSYSLRRCLQKHRKNCHLLLTPKIIL